jgi:sugar O-acyltransferase (sialic acid O-acetyltransferase NeuD family)
MKKVIIVGASGHAKVAADIALSSGYELVGYLEKEFEKGKSLLGVPVLGGDSDLDIYINEISDLYLFIAIGDNFFREQVWGKIAELNFPLNKMITLIHPSAVVSSSGVIGYGNLIGANAVVGPDSKIGDFCILNTNASIDHDCCMGNFASVSPNVGVGGNCKLGDGSFIGIGASISHGVSIGENAVVGANSFVSKDIESNSVVYGTPACFVKKRKNADKYL